MRIALRRIALGLGLAGCGISAFAQTDFGDQLMNWVNNDVPGLSRRIVAADFPVRIHNVFVLASEENMAFLNRADVELRALTEHMQQDALNVASMGVRGSLDLQSSAFAVQARLARLREEFDATRSRLRALEGEDLDLQFARSGAYNVGYAGVFSSYADISKGPPTSFLGRYPQVTVTYVDGPDGKQTSLSSPDAGGAVAGGVELGRRLAIAYGADAVAANVWAGMILFWYAVWEMHEASEEYKKQSETFYKAVAAFPSKTMPVEEQLALFKTTWAAVGKAHQPVLDKLHANNEEMERRLKSAFARNAGRLALSRSMVTQEKLREAIAADAVLPADKRIFSALKNQAALSDLRRLEGYTRLLNAQVNVACGDLKGVNLAEEYGRSGLELGQLAQAVLARPTFGPIHSKVAGLAKEFDPELIDVRRTATSVGARQCLTVDATNTGAARRILAKKARELSLRLASKLALRPKRVLAVTTIASSMGAGGNFNYCYTSPSGYGCSSQNSPNGGFGQRFPSTTGDPAMGSPGDGGYSDRLPSATNAPAAATGQIESRIKTLGEQSKNIDAKRSEWLDANVTALSTSQATQSESYSKEDAAAQVHMTANAAALVDVKSVIDNFVAGPLTLITASKLAKDADIAALSPIQQPLVFMRDGGPALLVLNANETTLSPVPLRDVERLRYEQDMSTVGRRVDEATPAKPDPVFANSNEFQRLREYGRMSLVMADRLASEKQVMTPVQKSRADRALEGALLNVKASRYYAWGYGGARFIHDTDVLNWKGMKTHMVNTISEFLSCNAKNSGTADMSDTACNKMVGTALNRLYGVKDFGGPSSFLLANDIAKFVASSPDWTLVGPALAQEALDDAGMLAALGRTVITVWANPVGTTGHVNIVLPGVPYEQAKVRPEKWGDLRLPRTVNFHWCTGDCDPVADPLTYADDTIDRAYQKLSPQALKNVLIYVRDRKAP